MVVCKPSTSPAFDDSLPRVHMQAFKKMAAGDKNAMVTYNDFQVKQLTKLIEVTRTDLPKPDRQKIM